jgi:hypothetical protein
LFIFFFALKNIKEWEKYLVGRESAKEERHLERERKKKEKLERRETEGTDNAPGPLQINARDQSKFGNVCASVC